MSVSTDDTKLKIMRAALESILQPSASRSSARIQARSALAAVKGLEEAEDAARKAVVVEPTNRTYAECRSEASPVAWLYFKVNDRGSVTGPYKTDSEEVARGPDCIDATPILAPACECKKKQLITGEQVWWISSADDPQPHCVKDLKYCSAAAVESGEHLKYIPVQRMQVSLPPQATTTERSVCNAGTTAPTVPKLKVGAEEPFGWVTVVRRSVVTAEYTLHDEYNFYKYPDPPYLDNASELYTVYTRPQKAEYIVPEGWKLVPIEPTTAMIDAVGMHVEVRLIWRRMLRAAGSPD